MMKSEREEFYKMINESDSIPNEIKKIIGNEESLFFEVCNSFSCIAMNADKYREEGAFAISAFFHTSDIDKAKKMAISFIRKNGVHNMDGILEAIYKFHYLAVEQDDERQKYVYTMDPRQVNENYKIGGIGQFVNCVKLPKNIWDDIMTEIKSELHDESL